LPSPPPGIPAANGAVEVNLKSTFKDRLMPNVQYKLLYKFPKNAMRILVQAFVQVPQKCCAYFLEVHFSTSFSTSFCTSSLKMLCVFFGDFAPSPKKEESHTIGRLYGLRCRVAAARLRRRLTCTPTTRSAAT